MDLVDKCQQARGMEERSFFKDIDAYMKCRGWWWNYYEGCIEGYIKIYLGGAYWKKMRQMWRRMYHHLLLFLAARRTHTHGVWHLLFPLLDY